MIITSGKFAGIPLYTPENKNVRPTLAKTRQAVFNMLRERLPGAVCVDIFCGTGAFGFEALSNGAIKIVFIDRANRALILKNAAKLKIDAAAYEVLTCDYERGIGMLAGRGLKADIIFADPPYNMEFITKLLKNADLSDILDTDALMVVEIHRDEMKKSREMLTNWDIVKEKKYGDTYILLLKKGAKNG